MNTTQIREERFLNKILPIFQRLSSQWFHPQSKNKDGLHYSCIYCDQGCGEHKSHDFSCLSDRAKVILEEFKRLDSDLRLQSNYKGEPRVKEKVSQILVSMKVRMVLRDFYSPVLT